MFYSTDTGTYGSDIPAASGWLHNSVVNMTTELETIDDLILDVFGTRIWNGNTLNRIEMQSDIGKDMVVATEMTKTIYLSVLKVLMDEVYNNPSFNSWSIYEMRTKIKEAFSGDYFVHGDGSKNWSDILSTSQSYTNLLIQDVDALFLKNMGISNLDKVNIIEGVDTLKSLFHDSYDVETDIVGLNATLGNANEMDFTYEIKYRIPIYEYHAGFLGIGAGWFHNGTYYDHTDTYSSNQNYGEVINSKLDDLYDIYNGTNASGSLPYLLGKPEITLNKRATLKDAYKISLSNGLDICTCKRKTGSSLYAI